MPVYLEKKGQAPNPAGAARTTGDKHGAEGHVVIREALRKVGLGQVTVAGRDRLVAVMPAASNGNATRKLATR